MTEQTPNPDLPPDHEPQPVEGVCRCGTRVRFVDGHWWHVHERAPRTEAPDLRAALAAFIHDNMESNGFRCTHANQHRWDCRDRANDMLTDTRVAAALSATPAPERLDVAWAEAEAALPYRGDRRLSWKLRLTANGKGTYHAEYLPPFAPYEEWMDGHREAFGDSAPEALTALAARLRESGS